MFEDIPMPTKAQLASMTDDELVKNLDAARKALQQAEQLAKNFTQQEKVFEAFEAEYNARSKSSLTQDLEDEE